MATTPEEFFVKSLMGIEPSPPSPTVYLDLLPPTPDPDAHSRQDEGQLAPNDPVLPYISRVLLEDDMDSEILCQYHDDHPVLLQAQQPFAEILSSSSTAVANSGDQSSLLSSSSMYNKGVDAVEAFFKGMEEASTFLPGDKISRSEEGKEPEVVAGSVTKTNKARTRVLGEMSTTHEILDEVMLRGYETCIQDMEKLRITMDNEPHKNKMMDNHNKKGGCKKKASRRDDDGVDLRGLLIRCAREVDEDNHRSASLLLLQIEQHASPTGDATQRLAHYFAKGLQARLLGVGVQLWRLAMAERPSVAECLRAYRMYMAACCFGRVPVIFIVKTILHAIAGKKKLHIVDYGLDYGLRWSALLRWLASDKRLSVKPEVKITAVAHPDPAGPCRGRQVEEAGRQLSICAREAGLPSFKFDVVTDKWESVCVQRDCAAAADEALIVNDLYSFNTLMEESVYFDTPSPRDTVLANIARMRPDVFIQSVVNNACGATAFLSRFREALHYYSAMFDALDATMPRGSEERRLIEEHRLGPNALNIVACEGRDRVHRLDTYKQWQLRNRRAGLRQLPLDQRIVDRVRDEVRKHPYHEHFVINEDHSWLLQGWKGRILYAHFTWVAGEDASCSTS